MIDRYIKLNFVEAKYGLSTENLILESIKGEIKLYEPVSDGYREMALHQLKAIAQNNFQKIRSIAFGVIADPEILHVKENELKSYLGKRTEPAMMKQLPDAINFCVSLLKPYLNSKQIDKIEFTRKDIEEKAREWKINGTMAREIHKNLPKEFKGTPGRPPKK